MRNDRHQDTKTPRHQAEKMILFAFCVLCLASLLSGCAKREITNIDSKGESIVCFGDSITFGYGVNTGEDYPSILANTLPIKVINGGIDGDTTIEALKRMDTDVLDRDPRLVIIEFGGNDFLRGIPKEVTINNITEMVDRVQAQGAMAAVVDISAGFLLDQYRVPLYNLCKEKGAIFIPKILRGIITNPSLKSDFIHPNSKGYKLIARRIYRAILPYLNQNISALKGE